jgi:peptidoglycan/xylan/chitin deacetylase (PgdA/CDA1 family)/phage-related protein
MNNLYKLPFKVIMSTLPVWATTAYAQNPTVSFAAWKDNAKAAYTIVHDDFGDATTGGIVKYADTIAFNRNVRFSFGAITSVCDGNDWSDARRLINHGHEIVNHSHSHYCSHDPGWCATKVYSSADFGVELDGSTNLIEQNTGNRPRIFVHPFDLSTQQVLDRLKNLGYLGARSGSQGALNYSGFNDYFRLNFFVHDLNSNLNALNQSVQSAVSSGGYLMRELHGVGDGSWAPVSVSDYRSHLNYVKDHMNAGNLWAATASEVITYKIQKDSYYPSVSYNSGAKTLTVSFSGGSSVQTGLFKTPVTINIQLNGLSIGTNLTVKQNGETLYAQVSGSKITVNAYPHKGNIVINTPNTVSCEPNCPPPPPSTCNADGKFKVEVWTNLTTSSRSMSDLTGNSKYPNSPNSNSTVYSNNLSRTDIGADKYGERLTTYLKPSVTGNYIFAVSGDDDVELYLSTTNNSGNKTKIAGFKGSTTPQQWTKYSGQKSKTIALKANQTYYMEVLHMAVSGDNHCQIGWQKAGESSFTVIPNSNFTSQPCTSTSQPLVILNGTRAGQTALLDWSTSQVDENTPYTVERLEANGHFSELGTGKDIQFADETPINGINIYRVRYTDAYGQTRHSEPVKLNFTQNPNVYLAPNPATNEVSVDLREWNQAAVTVYLYDVRGAEVQRVTTTASDTPYTLDLNSVQAGQYMIRVQSADGRAIATPLMVAK